MLRDETKLFSTQGLSKIFAVSLTRLGLDGEPERAGRSEDGTIFFLSHLLPENFTVIKVINLKPKKKNL